MIDHQIQQQWSAKVTTIIRYQQGAENDVRALGMIDKE